MIISKLYNRYFQKSKSFLYPILNFKRKMPFPPRKTYIAWSGVYKIEDNKLIVTFDMNLDTKQWENFRNDILMEHPMFYELVKTTEEYLNREGLNCKRQVEVLVYDLSELNDDFKHFVSGKYSEISSETKSKIRTYYAYDSPEWAYMESFLFPEKYFKQYARLLNVEESLLIEVGELCEPPNFEKETFDGEYEKSLDNLPLNFVDLKTNS